MRVGSGLVGVIRPGALGARILITRTTRLLGLARASAVSLRVPQRARAEGCEREARARGPPRSPDSDSCTSISRDHLVPRGDDDRATTAGRSWRSLVDELAPGLRLSLIASLMDGIDRRRVSTHSRGKSPRADRMVLARPKPRRAHVPGSSHSAGVAAPREVIAILTSNAWEPT